MPRPGEEGQGGGGDCIHRDPRREVRDPDQHRGIAVCLLYLTQELLYPYMRGAVAYFFFSRGGWRILVFTFLFHSYFILFLFFFGAAVRSEENNI